jgi:aminopeptidase N
LAAVLCLLAACQGGDRGEGPSASDATAGTTSLPPASAPPASLPPATAPSCPPIPQRVGPAPDRPRYVLDLDVRPAEARVAGRQQVELTPDFDTDRLVFRLWPNGPRQRAEGAGLDLSSVEIEGREIPASLDDPTTLVVRPGTTIRAGQRVRAGLRWTLRLPRSVRDRISAEAQSVRLGSFFPIAEWEPGVGWLEDAPTSQFAEASTAPTADFALTVAAPEGFTVLASGVQDRPGHWTATAMRDVAVAVGRFTVSSAVAHAPDPVQVIVGVQAGVADQPSVFLDKAVAVLEDFGRRFGPYPWPTFTVSVTPTLRSGVEYPAHVLHGPGTSGRQLSHEIGHQWFYALVGNNQARHPWIDEGAASWAEARWERTLDGFRARAVPADARGRLNEPMTFWDPRSSAYYPGVYVQGVQALGALGDPDLVDCALRVFVAQNAYRVATPTDFVAAMRAVFPDAAATLTAFGVRS